MFSALMSAFCVVIAWFCKSYFTFGAVRLTFENLPLIFVGILLGPAYGAAVGASADIISALLSGFSINPLITLGAAMVGAVAGFAAKFIKSRGYFGVFGISLLSHIVGTMVIKSFALWQMGYALPMVWIRVPLYFVIAVLESYFIYILFKNRTIAFGIDR